MAIRRSLTTAAAASFVAFAALALPMSAAAQDGKPRRTAEEIAKTKPSGTFELSAEQLSLLVGGAAGKGTLTYGGKPYPFTMKAAAAGSVGVTKVNATGTVYFLDRVEDFAGRYSLVSASGTVVKGAGGSQYENQKGVFLSVKSKSEGLALNLGVGVVQIDFVK